MSAEVLCCRGGGPGLWYMACCLVRELLLGIKRCAASGGQGYGDLSFMGLNAVDLVIANYIAVVIMRFDNTG
jgi:hypothetical protein